MVHKLKHFAIAATLAIYSTGSWGNYGDFATLLPQGSEMGFILRAADGSVLAEHNADKLMLPASTLKLLTATAAWLELGPEFRYYTRLYVGEVSHGVAEGDLVIQMSGDPTFTRADLYRLLQQVKQVGIHTIKGRLIFDDQLFSGYDRARGWPWDDLGVCFAAPTSAVMLDSNCVRVALEPHAEAVTVKKASHIPLVIRSEIRNLPMGPLCPLELYVEKQVYKLSGCTDKKTTLALALDQPKHYVSAVIKQQLAELNIALLERGDQDQVITSQVAQHHSVTLPKLLQRVLSRSDNLISDSLLRTMGAKTYQIGSFQAGIRALEETLSKQLPLDLGSSDLYDGSGLSRYNLISPRTLSALLNLWQQDERLQPLMAMLPVAGQSGTLRYRAGTAQLGGKLRAKTGSFQQVANIAGFIDTADKDNLVVVQFINGINGNREQTKQQITEFEQALFQCIHFRCFQNN